MSLEINSSFQQLEGLKKKEHQLNGGERAFFISWDMTSYPNVGKCEAAGLAVPACGKLLL